MKKINLLLILCCLSFAVSCQNNNSTANKNQFKKPTAMESNKVVKTEEEWKKVLNSEQYNVLRLKGTEAPFTGKYNMHAEKGKYTCGACGYELFTSDMKFDSHCGWPSFDKEIGDGSRIKKIKDMTHGMVRTEIVCARCEGHLGHIFDDGPTATGQRYCVNSLSIEFLPSDTTKKK